MYNKSGHISETILLVQGHSKSVGIGTKAVLCDNLCDSQGTLFFVSFQNRSVSKACGPSLEIVCGHD